jgi:hypothetical protein
MFMFTTILSLVLVLQVQLTSAHVCIIHPPQRGPLSVTTPGDPSCYRRTGPCGGVKQTLPGTPFVSGSTVRVLVQQNLNHWVSPTTDRTSGFFSLKLANASSDGMDVLLDTWSDFPAWDEVTQTNFSREITIPVGISLGDHLLTFSYVSYNKDEIDPPSNKDAIFYNCADIQVVSNTSSKSKTNTLISTTTTTTTPKPKPSADNLTYTCTTPDMWSAKGVETTSKGDFIQHYIVVDNIQQQMYWSRETSTKNIQSFPTVTTITNFTSSREYVLTEGERKCAIYGPDQFYRLSFGGAPRGMTGGIMISDDQIYGFHGYPIDNGITWTAKRTKDGKFCLPLSRVTPSSSLQWNEAKQLDVIPSGQFSMPSICNQVDSKLDQILFKNGGKSIPGCGSIV